MYDYRKMTPAQRREIVEHRRRQERPLHSPPHWEFEGQRQFIMSAACFDHAPVIGKGPERMTACEGSLLEKCEKYASVLYAWCLLPNHYHLLVRTERLKELKS
jgi:REP-associated tyrosine transposase